MRLLAAAMLVAGVVTAPAFRFGAETAGSGEHVEWSPYDDAAVASAVAGGGPVIIDFYADWCAPCKELDEKTFADPEVRSTLASYARFKVDLTRSTVENQRLTGEYEVLGVPTVIVVSEGEEVFRITGFEPPAQFLGRLRAVPSGS
jgi:thiol:disulfide interchange protein DsbD